MPDLPLTTAVAGAAAPVAAEVKAAPAPVTTTAPPAAGTTILNSAEPPKSPDPEKKKLTSERLPHPPSAAEIPIKAYGRASALHPLPSDEDAVRDARLAAEKKAADKAAAKAKAGG